MRLCARIFQALLNCQGRNHFTVLCRNRFHRASLDNRHWHRIVQLPRRTKVKLTLSSFARISRCLLYHHRHQGCSRHCHFLCFATRSQMSSFKLAQVPTAISFHTTTSRNRSNMPNVLPCRFVRDLGKELFPSSFPKSLTKLQGET